MNSFEAGACPACGAIGARELFQSSDRLLRTTAKVFSVVECAGCRLPRLQPWPSPAELAGYYPTNYWYVPETDPQAGLLNEYRRFVLRDHVHFVLRALRESGEQGPVLDISSGGGLFSRLLRERGVPALGMEFSCDAAAAAWSKNGVASVCGTISRPPFPEASFSAITLFHVLERLFDPVAYLEAARALLRPGGRLIVQSPNAACWQFLLLCGNWSYADVPRRLFLFRAQDLKTLLEECGFEIVRTQFFALRDNPAGLATSLAPGLDPMLRRILRVKETPRISLLKDVAYLGLVTACLPFTLLEAACHAGSTVLMEARKKG